MRVRVWKRSRALVLVLLAFSMVIPIGVAQAGALAPSASPNDIAVAGEVHAASGNADFSQLLRNLPAKFETVFPPDDRMRVTPTTKFPASAVGLVITGTADPNGPALGCTGTFIGPQVVLTAAQCLYNPELGGWADFFGIFPGNDGNARPFGVAAGNLAWVPAGWRNGYDASWDWGLIKFPEAVGDVVGWFKVGVLSTATLSAPHFKPTAIGYPLEDKPFGTQWLGQKEAFLSVEPHVLKTDLDMSDGQSGSAVWRGSDGMIVGVVVRGTPGWNEASRIDQQLLTTLNDACTQMRCEIAQYVEPAPPTPPPTGNPAPPASSPDTAAFVRTWARTDKPVADLQTSRTWMWGPKSNAGPIVEPYADAAGGNRTVEYFDKSRMEITNPSLDPNSLWYVTNGLLAKELITGRMQVGNDTFVNQAPAQVNIAGDLNDPNGPTYASFNRLLGNAPIPLGWKITQTVDRAGNIGDNPSLAGYGVTTAVFVPQTNHNVASVFWDFMNSSGLVYQGGGFTQDKLFQNPYYATGYPITEAYWTTVMVGGVSKQVLVQVFERRVLTYTPSNPAGWQVESGNVGLQYYLWRYGQ